MRRTGAHIQPYRRRTVSLLLTLALLCALLPCAGFATEDGASPYLCGHIHDETCGYAAPSEGIPCGHVCTEECLAVPAGEDGAAGEPACVHVHDEACGYIAPTEGVPCTHICQILSLTGAPATYDAAPGASCQDIAAALPAVLTGTLACAAGAAEVPVRWSCADYTDAAGTYLFRAELTNGYCVYAVPDDAQTVDTDESALPAVAVTVPEALPEPEPGPAPAHPVCTVTDETNTVSVTGPIPEGAYLEVTEVPAADARTLLGQAEAEVLFAYDIRIMLPGEPDASTGECGAPTEYQPPAEHPVTVTITPEVPIEAPAVEVVHIAENAETGETTPQPVATVTPAENSVEFEAQGFSVYIIQVVNSTLATHTVRFPVGDYKVTYSTSPTGTFSRLYVATVTLGSTSASGSKYDTLYFKVAANAGFTLGTVTSSRAGTLTLSGDVYALTVTGTAATTDITIPVTGVKITGTPARGQTLVGTVSDDLSSLPVTYDWQYSNAANGTFAATGQTGATFALPNSEIYDNQYIRVEVTNGTDTYTSAPVGPVTEAGTVVFDLAEGTVQIGDSGTYRGYNSGGALVAGTHNDSNKYLVIQSNSATVTENRIILIGGSPIPTYDVTLNGLNCATDTNKNIGGVFADALANAPMTIILRLAGDNYVGRVHYATGGAGDSSVSSLTITSASGDGSLAGHLVAYSKTRWSAAIGGIDATTSEASRNITIAGGTIEARTDGDEALGTSAIGGGGNGYSDVRITGGSVTAYNCGTGATIGGGGGQTSSGGTGNVTITGGTVFAQNGYANGVAIGGGGSLENTGSSAEVTITGGTVTANGSIGGGYSERRSGGAATVDIEGGKITTTGSIGGGNSTGNSGGTADITITGGTISAANISGGHGAGGSHAGGDLSITGGSAKVDHICNFITTTGIGGTVASYTVVVKDALGNAVTDKPVTAVVFSPALSNDYGLVGVRTDAEGKLYLWLPTGVSVQSVTADGVIYGTVQGGTGSLVQKSASITVRTPPAVVGGVLTAVLTGDTATTWQWQRYTAGNWVDIVGATSEDYTVQTADAGCQLLVIINGVHSLPISVTAFYVVVIPETVTMNTTCFTISGSRTNFRTAQTLVVTVTSESGFRLTLTGRDATVPYSLRTTPGGTAVASGGAVATFVGSGQEDKRVYYTVDTPAYSGTYTDTLTFTVTLN